MAVGFSNIPADIRVPLFYAEMDNSAANTAASAMRRLIVAQVNDNGPSEGAGKLVLVPSVALAKSIGGQWTLSVRLGSPTACLNLIRSKREYTRTWASLTAVGRYAERVGQKWGNLYANQCHLMPNGTVSCFVKKALQPLLPGAVGLFCVNTRAQSACDCFLWAHSCPLRKIASGQGGAFRIDSFLEQDFNG